MSALDDENWYVRINSTRALSVSIDPKAEISLIDAFKRENKEVRKPSDD